VTNANLIRILYMEDDLGLARLLQKMLQRRGFDVDIAADGEEGLVMLDAKQYDIVLVDYNMPFLGGLDVISALSAKNALLPTIMVTGQGNEMVAVEALKLGAVDYVVKDVNMKYLDLIPSVIDQVMLRQQMLRERQQMLETVKASEERYRLLFNNNPIPSMAYDLQTLRVIAVNDAAITHYGHTEEEFLSLTITDLYTPEETPALLNVLAKVDQGTSQAGVWKHRLKNGSLIEVDITSHCLMLNNIKAHLILAHDITEQNKMKENLLQTQKLESLGVLAGGLAHDFNNLLTAILGNLSLAKLESTPGENTTRYLEVAEKATTRAQGLTQQLLTFASGGAPVKQTLSIGKLLEESAGVALRGSRSRCEFKIAPDLRDIEADEKQLEQVVHNLIKNADQSMPESGTITVTGENITLPADNPLLLKPGDYIKVSITDQGTGIPADDLEKIFEPYFTTKQTGSGLGLATCYSIIKRHDGHITAESGTGKGATLSLYLLVSSVQAAPVALNASRAPVLGNGRILVMDDEAMVRDVLRRSLTNLGYEVVCTHEGSKAVTLYEQALKSNRPFNAVIMDLTIPDGMGGKDAVIKLQEIDPGVKAIVSSGYSNDPVMANYKEFGFSGVVSKPYSIQSLSEAVHKVLSA
jgi:two-component system cell cycle sensor histidine kinase/response regulator CckA